ncbi:hypothetical protein JYU34_011571 [Plutella xylostella]|uniref:Uncharacterized protein n=1 Tax=Plutella xylostella TaxID=51655 RepID=A0ABQ7QKY3_PLUXY|nr:hypothetical protein JYU34_011571 [Plutella xylostella]
MNVIVDVQGFKTDDNQFILKEIAMIHEKQVQVFLIKPPFAYYDLSKTERRQVSWIERNRGIYWKEGFIPYSCHKNYIVQLLSNKIIYTKGMEKVKWLIEITKNNNVYNLEDKNCPSLLSLYDKYNDSIDVISCMYHTDTCALKNVTCLNKWLKENKVF